MPPAPLKTSTGSRATSNAPNIRATIEATLRATALPDAYGDQSNAWSLRCSPPPASAISSHRFHDEASERSVVDFHVRRTIRPRIRNCIENASGSICARCAPR